ncbi:hypothetical protein S7711_09317 [Stachybotrys chartarum IBT 7711]|uniref:Defective in cullin neddylation protein n=1 Tax=Stachybotrys chartarum (strain CBS 109288 / IBT 7711) TaxID=1280523 RepID=A0A084ARQ8_STACB|nr:hypothetical protein S7711_09317 [Stachybotrys chartarum IBT 7711]
MGWKDVRHHLPAKVVTIWPSTKKASKNATGGAQKGQTQRYHTTLPVDKSQTLATEVDDLSHAKWPWAFSLPVYRNCVFFASGQESNGPSQLEAQLDALFDSLRDDKQDSKNQLELESTMNYLTNKLKVNLENAEMFIVQELLQAPSIGEITRKGYVDGWKMIGAGASHQEHAAHVAALKSGLRNDPALFKKVYKYAFITGKERDQKSLSLENALVFWGMLFSHPGMEWKTRNNDWLDLWKTFLGEKWTRSVNKDMWNMTLEFALKSMVDESLSFWNEDGAWPSVIDDFVAWCRQKGVGKPESMEVDA